jgi:hypothetical protein
MLIENRKAFGVLFLVAIMGSGCNSSSNEQNEFDPSLWENNIYSRIGEAPVDGGFTQEEYWVWGSSVIRGDDGKYHMFVSRWPKYLPFHPGWMVASEIVHAVSDTPEGPYEFVDVALPSRGPEYWDGRATHNPRIFKHNDTYILIYMGSTNPFADVMESDAHTLTHSSYIATVARSNKRIGIATSQSPYGPWERRDEPILQTKPGTFYSFLTSNPSPWINEDGSVIMLFKSRSYKEDFPFQTAMTIGVATAPSIDGPFEVVGDEPIFGIDKMGEVEDPFLWKDETGYHMLAKDQRGTITGNFHSGILAHSTDGINWVLDDEPLAYTRMINWSDGTNIEMGQLERVFGLMESGKITHLFFATMDGLGGFNNSTHSWNMVFPLKD